MSGEGLDEVDSVLVNRETLAKGVCCEWTQTQGTVNVIIYVGSTINRPNEINIQVTESELTVNIEGNTDFTCKFFAEVESDATRVKLKKGSRSFSVTLKKSTKEYWKSFTKCAESEDITDTETSKDGEDDGDAESEDDSRAAEDSKEIEPTVYELNHVKHDWYEKGQKSEWMVVNVYIKQIKKDTLLVEFHEKSINLKFQTSDKKFLSIHGVTDEETMFNWKINLKSSLDKENCKYKVSSALIEMTLKKEMAGRWGDLQATHNKSGSTPATNIWVSTAKQQANLATVKPNSTDPALEKEVIPLSYPSKPSDSPEKESRPVSYRGFPDGSGDTTKDKPTCMVSPLSTSKPGEMLVSPGMTGLDNLGNTCFMNSVIQVLANTQELRDFFLDGKFQHEINIDNPLGTSGKIAVAFAVCLKVLWSGKQYSYSPVKLKNIVASKASQFTGFAQHDAQEFMAFLLDGLHEDLNRIKNKPYTQSIDSDGRPDEIVAQEAWDIHKQRNDSFIVDLFQGQYKSKLVCPVCEKVSITFDPFMILPVPLPKKQITVTVFFYSKDPYKRPIKYVLKLQKESTFENLKEALSRKTNVPPAQMKAFVTHKGKFSYFLGKRASVSSVSSVEKLIVCEVLSEQQAGEQVLEIAVIQRTIFPLQIPTRCSYCQRECPTERKLKRCTKCLKAAYCDQSCQRNDWHSKHRTQCKASPNVAGCPFIISVPQSGATYERITQMMEVYARYSMEQFRPPITAYPQNIAKDEQKPEQNCAVESSVTTDTSNVDDGRLSCSRESTEGSLGNKQTADATGDATRWSHQGKNDGSVPVQVVSGKLQSCAGTKQSLFFVKPCDKEGRSTGERIQDEGDNALDLSSVFFLAMDWNNNEKSKSYVMVNSKELEYDEDSENMSASEENGDINLSQCMETFTEPEVLSPEHAWYCPRCKEHREASKQLSIWKLPETLIIQLKRFSFRNMLWRDKIDKMIHFPTTGLDMSQYYIGNRPTSEPPPIYDLYGVINHHGGILGGHYTSFGRCPMMNSDTLNEVDWRLFDDSRVTRVGNRSVDTRAAYVLFYRRRRYDAGILPNPSVVDTKNPGHKSTVDESNLSPKNTAPKISTNMMKNVNHSDSQSTLLSMKTEKQIETMDCDTQEAENDGLESDEDAVHVDEAGPYTVYDKSRYAGCSVVTTEPLPYTDMDAVD